MLVVHNPRAAHVHELCQMFEVLRHLGGQDHVYDRVTNLFVRLPFQILRKLRKREISLSFETEICQRNEIR